MFNMDVDLNFTCLTYINVSMGNAHTVEEEDIPSSVKSYMTFKIGL